MNLVQNLIVAALTLVVSPVFHFYAKLGWPSLIPVLVGLFILVAVGVHSLRSRPRETTDEQLAHRPERKGILSEGKAKTKVDKATIQNQDIGIQTKDDTETHVGDVDIR